MALSIATQQQKRQNWQTALIQAITCPEELFEQLNLDKKFLPAAKRAAQLFDLRVPRNFIAKMAPGNLNDPLLKQILPLEEEFIETPGFSKDPLQEILFNPVPGLLHKYHGRVLLTITSACAINCRYCFRRHFSYSDNNMGRPGREALLKYLKEDASIQEVIYSGGDPLLAPDDYLRELSDEISAIPHIKRLRIHSRLPIVLPERITPSFVKWFAKPSRQNILVVHCNHPNELDRAIKQAITSLKKENVTIFNQAVLLKGINDSTSVQVELSEKLFEHGILPYYLHMLDKTQGTTHFEVSNEKAAEIYEGMQSELPGYLVPKLVKEIPGIPHKTITGIT